MAVASETPAISSIPAQYLALGKAPTARHFCWGECSGQQRPAKASKGQQRPAKASKGQQRPAKASKNQQNSTPITVVSGERSLFPGPFVVFWEAREVRTTAPGGVETGGACPWTLNLPTASRRPRLGPRPRRRRRRRRRPLNDGLGTVRSLLHQRGRGASRCHCRQVTSGNHSPTVPANTSSTLLQRCPFLLSLFNLFHPSRKKNQKSRDCSSPRTESGRRVSLQLANRVDPSSPGLRNLTGPKRR
jgi:hypothetical protein